MSDSLRQISSIYTLAACLVCGLLLAPATSLGLQESGTRSSKSKDLSKQKASENKTDDAEAKRNDSPAEKPKAKSDAKPESEDKAKDQDQDQAKSGDEETEESQPRRRRRRRTRSTAFSRSSRDFLGVFAPIIKDTATATVKIKNDDKTIALGAIVDSAGFVLTKKSELKSPLSCEMNDGRKLPAHIFGIHEETDLALLKVQAEDLPVIEWASNDNLEIGNWLATVKEESRPLGIGVVGVKARFIKRQSGFMGVNLVPTEDGRGTRITGVTANSPAERGGLQVGDIVFQVNGETIFEQQKLITKIKSFPPGEKVRLTARRNDKEIFLDVVLGEERELNPNFRRSNQQNTMGGELSARRQNFPLAVQHDTLLAPQDCGGPVVNLDGQVVGFNIARQGRVASLMLPGSLVRTVIEELRSGQLAPALVNKDRINEINRVLEELGTKVALSPMNNKDFKKRVNELTRKEKELRRELEAVLKKRIRAEVEYEQASNSFSSNNKEIERLKEELQSLVTGSN